MKIDDFKLLIQAGNPIIAMETPDETRAVRLVREVADAGRLPLVEWSVTEGLRDDAAGGRPDAGRAGQAGRRARPGAADDAYPALYVFKDVGPHCKDPQVVRSLRDLYFSPDSRLWTRDPGRGDGLAARRAAADRALRRRLARRGRADGAGPPHLPGGRRIAAFGRWSRSSRGRELEMLVQTLRGLTTEEAGRVVSGAIYEDNVLDRSDLLRVVDAKRHAAGHGRLPGGHRRRRFAGRDRRAEEPEALVEPAARGVQPRRREFGIEPPRGILLLGVQGCGKSLCAKVVASAWRMPLLRMDPGVLYQKFIGESEARLREALHQAESMSPVVLWIDEIEKAFASAGSDSADGGPLAADVRHAALLDAGPSPSHLPDRHGEQSVGPAAGADAQGAVRRDFLRRLARPGGARGHLLGPPAEAAAATRRTSTWPQLVAASDGFSGAEIEQAVISGLYAAFAAKTECTTDHILAAVRSTQPLSVVMCEHARAPPCWAKGRCVTPRSTTTDDR